MPSYSIRLSRTTDLSLRSWRRMGMWVICAFLMIGLSSCEKDAVTPTHTYTYFVNCTQSTTVLKGIVQAVVDNQMPSLSSQFKALPATAISVNKITYRTVDPSGKSVKASGLVAYPTSMTPIGVIVAEHVTIMSNAEAPTKTTFELESLYAFAGFTVIIPDLIGFGSTSQLTHPYLHAESTGRVSIDMVLAAREFLDKNNKPFDAPIYGIGYSQGGYSILAFQKMVEEKFATEIPLTSVYAGGGPYDLTATCKTLTSNDYTPYSAAVPYIAIGLNYGDQLNLDFSKVFKGDLLTHYDDWYNSKNYTIGTISNKLGTKLSNFMHADMFTTEGNSELQKLYISLSDNSLISWTPVAPVHLFHCTGDQVVPYVNALNAYNAFHAKGCTVDLTQQAGGHEDGALPFYLKILNDIK